MASGSKWIRPIRDGPRQEAQEGYLLWKGFNPPKKPSCPRYAERHILHWKRGQEIATVGPRGQDGVLRLTFDVDGIREIERFCQQPQCVAWQKNNRRFAYAFVDTRKHDEFSRRFVYCRNGFLRLTLDRGDEYDRNDLRILSLPRIWDTPTPPDLTMSGELFHLEEPWVPSTGHFVSLDSISGLTFIYRGKILVAIHPHRGDDVEMNCPKTSVPSDWGEEACFFLPVAKEDSILGIGVGSYQNAFVIVVKKRLSGDNVIGLPCPINEYSDDDWEGPDVNQEDFFDKADFMWGQSDPKALVYGFSGKEKHLDLLGGYRGTRLSKPKWEGWAGTIPHLWPGGDFCTNMAIPFYTRAPLRGVVAAQMFFYPENPNYRPERICSGIIFHYDNGGSRVVGEIGLKNRARLAGAMILNPKFICLERDIPPGFDTPKTHFVTNSRFADSLMTCYPMRGTINWWFTARQRNSIEIHRNADEALED